jgi:hypothetical protein
MQQHGAGRMCRHRHRRRLPCWRRGARTTAPAAPPLQRAAAASRPRGAGCWLFPCSAARCQLRTSCCCCRQRSGLQQLLLCRATFTRWPRVTRGARQWRRGALCLLACRRACPLGRPSGMTTTASLRRRQAQRQLAVLAARPHRRAQQQARWTQHTGVMALCWACARARAAAACRCRRRRPMQWRAWRPPLHGALRPHAARGRSAAAPSLALLPLRQTARVLRRPAPPARAVCTPRGCGGRPLRSAG